MASSSGVEAHSGLSHPTYNMIPLIENAYKALNGDLKNVETMGEFLRSVNLNDKICAFLVHRHYDLDNEEYILLRSYKDDGFIVRPSVLTKTHVPCAYIVSGCGSQSISLRAFEYVDQNHAPAEALDQCHTLHKYSSILHNQLYSMIGKTELSFGYMIAHPEPDSTQQKIWIEESNEEEKWSFTRPVEKKFLSEEESSHLIQTTWSFSGSLCSYPGRRCTLGGGGASYKTNCIE